MDAVTVAGLAAAICAIGVAIDSAELLVTRAQLASGGFYDWRVLRTGQPSFAHLPSARLFDRIFSYPQVLAIPIVQLASAAVLVSLPIIGAPPAVGAVAAGTVLVARMLLYARNQYGQDGSDQMMLVVMMGATVALAANDERVASIAMAYVAAQLLLSYLVAGTAKAISPIWRSGAAIVGILSTEGYGVPALGARLSRHRHLAKALCWFVILFECLCPLLLVAGTTGSVVLIVLGLAFHLGIATLMGLNVFLWSFGAAYPAVYLVGVWVDGLWG